MPDDIQYLVYSTASTPVCPPPFQPKPHSPPMPQIQVQGQPQVQISNVHAAVSGHLSPQAQQEQRPQEQLEEQQQTPDHLPMATSDTAAQLSSPSRPLQGADESKLAFIGIMTIAERTTRRTLIRSTYLRAKPPSLDVRFILGVPRTAELAVLIAFENQTFGDLVVLDCNENMNDGKTFKFFEYLGKRYASRMKLPDGVWEEDGFGEKMDGEGEDGDENDNAEKHEKDRQPVSRSRTGSPVQYPYAFAMKVDDDAWLQLPALAERLTHFPYRNRTYLGRAYKDRGFMNGMGYLLSWDILEWISRDAYPRENAVGIEDQLVGRWVDRFASTLKNSQQPGSHLAKEGEGEFDGAENDEGNEEALIHRVNEDAEFYDSPLYKTDGEHWSHDYTPGTILVHQIKRRAVFLHAALHFLRGRDLLKSLPWAARFVGDVEEEAATVGGEKIEKELENNGDVGDGFEDEREEEREEEEQVINAALRRQQRQQPQQPRGQDVRSFFQYEDENGFEKRQQDGEPQHLQNEIPADDADEEWEVDDTKHEVQEALFQLRAVDPNP